MRGLGCCFFWRRKSTPPWHGALLPARPRDTRARVRCGGVLATSPPQRAAGDPTAMSNHGPHRVGAHINQRSTACGRSCAPEQSRTLRDRTLPCPSYNEIITKLRRRFRSSLTDPQISCGRYACRGPHKLTLPLRPRGRFRTLGGRGRPARRLHLLVRPLLVRTGHTGNSLDRRHR